MFILTVIEDTLFIPGASFQSTATTSQSPTSAASLGQAINIKYANRVIPDVGLCICLFDILEASEGKVKWGDGGLWHTVKARLAVFRPFVGEVLVGKVVNSNETGIKGETVTPTCCVPSALVCTDLVPFLRVNLLSLSWLLRRHSHSQISHAGAECLVSRIKIDCMSMFPAQVTPG